MAYPYISWRPYVPVAERRRRAQKKLARLEKAGRAFRPVVIEGRKIARTFWGEAWCENLESYSDFSNRLPRGRTYARNGSIMDLQIAAGKVTGLVSGSSLYTVTVSIERAPAKLWKELVAGCADSIGSVIELLEGRVSGQTMARLSSSESGLFPRPREMEFDCTCPDWARMCKHVAAVLYGVGARLDDEPELLFELRGVDHTDLVTAAAGGKRLGASVEAGAGDARVLEGNDLSAVFGIELDDAATPAPDAPAVRARRPRRQPASRRSGKPAPLAAAAKRSGKSARPRSVAPPARRKAGATERRAKGPLLGRIREGCRLRSKDLIELGVPRSTFQNWPALGALARTEERGVYRATSQTKPFLDRALRRKRASD